MVGTPLLVQVRRGALRDLGAVLADERISTTGRVAVAVGPNLGPLLVDGLRDRLARADHFTLRGGSIDDALTLADEVRQAGSYYAIVGVGGGRVIDATKYAAARLGLPMVAVATNLAHDGICSPVSTLDNDAGRGSYGVPAPLAVLVDLDLVTGAPRRSVTAGIGEALSNLSAIADWELSRDTHGEQIDGLAVTLARTSAQAVLHHPGTVTDDDFLVVLAEALVLSGIAIVVAGTTRPSSGGCHEISHALDGLFAARAGYHGEQVGLGAAFASFLRKDTATFEKIVTTLRRHGLPLVPADLGFSDEEFTRAVEAAPATRPGRYTILEHLDLDATAIRDAVDEYRRLLASETWA